MKKKLLLVCASLTLACSSLPLQAESFATKQDAEALVAKVITELKAGRVSLTYEAITRQDAKWVNGELYPVVYDMNGVVLAHGQNEGQIGKNKIASKDSDGKLYVKERVELAQSKTAFWQDYKYTDPVTGAILPKEMYCETLGQQIICAGIYKR